MDDYCHEVNQIKDYVFIMENLKKNLYSITRNDLLDVDMSEFKKIIERISYGEELDFEVLPSPIKKALELMSKKDIVDICDGKVQLKQEYLSLLEKYSIH